MPQVQGKLAYEFEDDYPTSYLPVSSSAVHITKLAIANFKRIRGSEILLAPFTVLTGVNNSGKSTILQAVWVAFECLRLCVNRETWRVRDSGRALTGFDFLPTNELQDLWYARKYRKGQSPLPISIRIELSNGFFFDTNINFYFAAINMKVADWNKDMGPDAVKETLALAPMLIPGHVEISPHEENRVPAQIHKHAMSSQLSPILRNVLLSLSGSSSGGGPAAGAYTFGFVAETIARHFDVSLEQLAFDPQRDLEIRAPYQENDWRLDIVSAGSGLHQILKLAAFVAWRKSRIVLLDEPDAHLHTSLQVRLASFLQELASGLGTQIVLATHSRDLISQVPIGSVIPVDCSAARMMPIESMDHLLAEYRRLGAIGNMDLALLYQTKRCLFVEGPSDVRLLPLIASQLGCDVFSGTNQIVVFEFKGKGKFTMVADLAKLFQRMIGSPIAWYVLRDRDSSTTVMFDHIKAQAAEKGIKRYHIWERYCLENYLLEPAAVVSAVQTTASSKDEAPPSEDEIKELLQEACSNVLKKVRASFIVEVQSYYARHELGGANPRARSTEEALELLKGAEDFETAMRVLPGSRIFGEFVQILQAKKKLTLRVEDLVRHLTKDVAPAELKLFLEDLRQM